MQAESKSVIDKFGRRFKSMQDFDPQNQVSKLLKFVQDLIKILNKQNKELF